MTRITRLLATMPLVAAAACINIDPSATVERRLERSFRVDSGASVRVELSGGAVTVLTGPTGAVQVSVRQTMDTREDERRATERLSEYLVEASQNGDEIAVVGRRKSLLSRFRWRDHVRLSATITAPPDVVLDINTSGGRINVRGHRTAPVRAGTSGGSVSVDGGATDLAISTSGGSIRVGRAFGRLIADTSGGGITVGYLAASAREVVLTTSGGSIEVGVDPAASLALDAGTSGGSVRVEDLQFDAASHGRSHATGTVNGGANRLRASTSGGGITIRGVADPG